MKTYKFYLLLLAYSSYSIELLPAQTNQESYKLSDREVLLLLLKAQKQSDDKLQNLFTTFLAAKSRELKIDIYNHNDNTNKSNTTAVLHTQTTIPFAQDMYEAAKKQFSNTYDSITNNKMRSISGALIAAYLSCAVYLHYQYYTVFTKDSWAHWCKHLNLPELISANLEGLTEKLVQDVHIHYINQENVHDIIIPHTRFLHEIDHQIDAASNYIYYYEILNSCYLARAFGLFQSQYSSIKEAHARLIFIKNLFITWISKKSL